MPRCPGCGNDATPGHDCPASAPTLAPDDPAARATATTPTLDAAEATLTGAPGAAPRRPAAGLRRIAHFAIRRELGAGGMGTVYLAHDERMNREVALKVMSRHQSSDKAGRRFEQEAWIAGRLDHPNIVKVYERGQWEDLSFFAMELVDGGSVADVIETMRRGGRDDALGLEFGTSQYMHWVVRTTIDAARGLDFAHRQGIVHRDVKPVNLLLNRKLGAVKIADFGIAMDVEAARMTTVGTVMGTLLYMAPEQIRGDTDRIDARTDVYALGVTLFEAITLQLPYTGKTQQLYMSQVLTSESRRARAINARVSSDLDTVLRKAMEKSPADRYQTAGAFAGDLENVLNLRPIEARPAGPLRRLTKWIRRRPVHAALAATLIVCVPAAGIVGARTLGERAAARRARIADLLDEARWLGQHDEYGAMLERASAALALAPGNVLGLRHRAMARFRLGDQEGDTEHGRALRGQGLADIDTVIAAAPGASWPHTLKAWMLTQEGRTEEATAEAARAGQLRADPPADDDIREEALLAMARSEYRQAVDLYSELIRRHPDSARNVSARAQAYEGLDEKDNALVDYRVAVGLDPKYDLAFLGVARMSADAGRFDDAEGYTKRALEIDPENPFTLETEGRIEIKRGLDAKVRGDIPEARRHLERAEAATRAALERSDALLWGRNNLGNAISEQAKLTDPPDQALMSRAIGMYQKVLEDYRSVPTARQPREVYTAAHRNLCDAQIALRRLQEALVTCGRAVTLSPDSPEGYYNLAGVQALLGHSEEALAALRRDLDLGDTDWKYLQADPWFERLRADRRFVAIVEEMERVKK